jgi:5-bromo-4-chloroindolyl phosphate hydrolysis protein
MVTGDGGIRAVKIARNQALWREVNERIVSLAETAGGVRFLCECANMDCAETLTLSVAEYEHIRSSPVRFPIKSGHDYPEFETVVEENEHYAVVQKRGKAAEVSEALDPRTRS